MDPERNTVPEEPAFVPPLREPNYPPPPPAYGPPKRRGRKLLIVIIILVVLAAGGAAAYFFLLKPKPAPPTPPPAKTAAQEEAELASQTKHYTSEEMKLEFDYPGNWKVSAADVTNIITIHSPLFSLKDADGQAAKKYVSVTISSAGELSPSYFNRAFTAAQASESLTYTKPTEGQRPQTLLALVTDADPAPKDGSFNLAYITGGQQYKKAEIMNGSKLKEIDPIIEIAVACDESNKDCTDAGRTMITAEQWESEATYAKLKEILASLQFK